MPLPSISRYAQILQKSPRKKKRKKQPRKIIPVRKRMRLGRGARGKVWVPVLTQEALTERHQYWNKVKMTKEDSLFREMHEKFTKIALDKDRVKLRVNQHPFDFRRNRPLSIPYPSGSCHTIVSGDFSTFSATPKFMRRELK